MYRKSQKKKKKNDVCKFSVRSFRGIQCTKDYIKPSLRESANRSIHVGTNDVNKQNKSPESTSTAESIANLACGIKNQSLKRNNIQHHSKTGQIK